MNEHYITIGKQIQNNTRQKSTGINPNHPYPNIDLYYGPYVSLPDALNKLNKNIRSIGLKFGIVDNGKIVDYWFEEGIEDINAVPVHYDLINKLNGFDGILQKLVYSVFGKDYEDFIDTGLVTNISVHYFILGLVDNNGAFEFDETANLTKVSDVSISEYVKGKVNLAYTGTVNIKLKGKLLYINKNGFRYEQDIITENTTINLTDCVYIQLVSEGYEEFNRYFSNSFDVNFN